MWRSFGSRLSTAKTCGSDTQQPRFEMKLGLSVIVLLLTVLNTFVCAAEEYPVQKDGVSKHNRRKRDLEEAELLLKSLLSKREQTKVHEDYEDYDEHGSEFLHEPQRESGRYESRGGHRKEAGASHENSKKREIVLTEDEMAELFQKMAKMIRAEKMSREKDAYFEESGEEHTSRATYSSKSHSKKVDSKFPSDSDKFNDEDVALAETLVHMKETGATAAYPEVKMEALYDKGLDKEDYRAEEDSLVHSDESYFKKVDEIGKTLIKEEVHPHIKEESMHEYLNKGEGPHAKDFLSHGIDEKLLKELKHSLSAGKDLAAEEEEILRLGKSLHSDGVEVHDELLKKAKMLLNGELGGEDNEKVLELVKHLEKDLLDRELSLKEGKAKDTLFAEKGISAEKAHASRDIYGDELFFDKAISAEKSRGIGSKGFIAKEHEGAHLAKGIPPHGIDDELLKKIKALLGADKEFKTEAGEFLDKEFHKGVEFDKEHKDLTHLLEEFDKDKALKEGTEAYAKAKEQAHIDAQIGFEESEIIKHVGSSFPHGAHEENAHKGFDEAELKKHIEDSFARGAHEKDAHLGFDKEIKKHVEGSFSQGAHEVYGKGAHKEFDEEQIKKHLEGSHVVLEKDAHKGFSEEEMKKHLEGSIEHGSHAFHGKDAHKGFSEEEMKKHLEGSLEHGSHAFHGKDAHKGFSEEELKKHLEGSLEHGSHAFHEKDAHKGFSEEELKKHLEGSLEHGSHAFHEKDAHKGFSEEEMKKHIEGSFAHGSHGVHGISAEKAHEISAKEAHGESNFYGLKHHASEEEKAHGVASKDFYGREKASKKGFATEEAHGIHHGIEADLEKSLHGMFEEGAEKKIHKTGGQHHEINPALGGEKHFVGHDADKAFKVHEDEFFRKEKAYGTDAFLHEDEDFAKGVGDHPVHHVLKDGKHHILHEEEGKHLIEGGAEGGQKHKVSHRLKARVYELLAELVRSSKCHLVTMRPTELLGIVNCISKKKDPLVCEKFAICERKMPPRVIEALEECRKKITPGELKKCTRHAPLFPSREIPLKIFQCMAIKVREVVGEERKQMIEFEKCARIIKAESCERVTWYHRRH